MCTLRQVYADGCGYQLVELDEPPFAVNVRVGGKVSAPGQKPGSAPGSALWHGVELDDLSALVESVVPGEQIVPLFAAKNAKEVIHPQLST